MSTPLLVQALAALSVPLAGLSGVLGLRLRRRAVAGADREGGLRERIAELERRCADLARSALRDPVTGVWNHRHLQLTLEREVERWKRQAVAAEPGQGAGPGELAVVLLEIEGFEAVNAEHGRGRGQAVLRDLAQRLSLEVRRSDTLGRYGGTEFLVVLPDTGAAGAAKVAERLCWTVRRHRLLDWSSAPWSAAPGPARGNGLTAAAGIAVLPADGVHAVPLLRAADGALAAAKAARRAPESMRGRYGSQQGPPERHGNLSACAGPGPTAHAGAPRTVAAVTVADEVRS
jgi:diguanylate cyclase (GGDEF)-like protein